MKAPCPIALFLLAALLGAALSSGFAPASAGDKPWSGALGDGTPLSREDLDKILRDHEKWIGDAAGEHAWGELRGAAQRRGRANLNGAHLEGADLSGALLDEANLVGAHLEGADLSGAHLRGIFLSEARLSGAKLGGAHLERANLSGADLEGADLSGADLERANLFRTRLEGADLKGVNVERAILFEARLRGADLSGANLGAAFFGGADVSDVLFEPKPGHPPDTKGMAAARNLSSLRFAGRPDSLAELREAFKRSGFHDQEREIGLAIRRSERLNLKNRLGSLFHLFFFGSR
jgi:uncharacterized protein YjbI with pentapeptide repeats